MNLSRTTKREVLPKFILTDNKGKFFLKVDAKILKQTKIIYSNAFYKHTYSFLYGGKLDLHTLFQPTFITHIPSLSLPSRFKTPSFCKAERSRSMVRWLTDICLPVIVGDSLMRFSIFCWRSVSFVSVMVSDIRGVGRCKDDGLKLGRSRFELGS